MSFSSPTGVSAPRANISGYKQRTMPNFTPEQMNLFSQLLGGAQKGLGGGTGGGGAGGLDYLSQLAAGDEGAFEQTEAPAYSAFDKLLGQMGSRFANVGALDSSAFQNATSGAAGEFAKDIGAQRMGIQQGAIERLLGLSQNLLGQRPYETFQEKKRTGWDNAGDFASILSKFLPMFM
jgi:hypothetical protein